MVDTGAARSLPLILARELASHLSTPMFLLDTQARLVYYNDAAELLIGKPFAELGEVSGNEFGEMMQLAEPDGTPLRRRDSPAGIAFIEQRPAHRLLLANGYDGTRHLVEATAYPLLGGAGEMHGVVNVFWSRDNGNGRET